MKNPLRMVFVETTTRCNLRCAHCRMESNCSEDDLDLTRLAETLENLEGKPMVVLSGGEPLIRPAENFSLAKRLGKCGFRVSLATNGTLVDKTMAERIKEAGILRVAVSIDGADEAVHDRVRRVDGAFREALRGVDHLKEAGIPFQFNTTVTKFNRDHLDRILELAEVKGAAAVHFFILVPVGCGIEVPEEERLDAAGYEAVMRHLLKVKESQKIPIRLTCAPQFTRLMDEEGSADAMTPMERMAGGCLAGKSVIFISAKGNVSPCGYFPISCGNINEDHLGEIWEESEVLHELRKVDNLEEDCGACAHALRCGGCRARSFTETGNMFGTDPICPYV